MRAAAPLLMAAPSRYAGLDAARARAIGLIWAALLLLCLSAPFTAPAPGGTVSAAPAQTERTQTDVLLYEAIVAGVRGGGDYYTVAADALRRGDYPLKPFFTFRLPTLAVIEARLPPLLVQALLLALALAVGAGWYRALRPAFPRPATLALALMLLWAGMASFVQAELVPFHEIWAGPLIALSLALWRPGAPRDAVCLGLAAMLIRETAALYVLVMLALALVERRRGEAIGWGVALGVFAVVITCHAWAVSRVVMVDDPASPGWHGLLGSGFVVRTLQASTALTALPALVGAPLIGLALIGWSGWRDPRALRVLAVIAAYAALLAVFGRADTFYWGLMIAPLPLIGLVFLPDAARDLWASLNGPQRRITITRVRR